MRIKSNKKIYDALGFTDNRDKIEEFVGKGSVVQTRLNGTGFAASAQYVVNCTYDQVWLSKDIVIIKNSDNESFWLPKTTFLELFKKEEIIK